MPLLEELQTGIRGTRLTPAQQAEKRNVPPPSEPSDLDIAIEAHNRNKPEYLTREQNEILRDAITRNFVTRGPDGKLTTSFEADLNAQDIPPIAPPSEAVPLRSGEHGPPDIKDPTTRLLMETGSDIVPSEQQQRRIDRLKRFEDRKTFGQEMLEDVKQHPGRTAGIVLSKAAPIATGFGTMAGEALDQHLQRAGILPGEAPKTKEEAGNRLLQGFTEGAVVGTIAKGTGKLISPFGKTVTPEGRAAIKTVRGLKGGKELVFPIEKATESGPIDTLGNIAEVAMWQGIRKFRQTQKVGDAIDVALRETATTLSKGKTTEQVADTISTIVTAGRGIYKKARNRAFDAIDELNPTIQKVTTQQGFKTKTLEDGTQEIIQRLNPETGMIENIPNMVTREVITKGGVDMKPIMAFIRKSLAREEDPLKKLPEMSRTLKELEEGGNVVSFKQADNAVIDLADFGFASMTATTKDQGLARVAQKMIKQQMETAAKQLPKEAYKRFRMAKRFAQLEATTYQRTIIKKMLKDTKDFTPENVWNMVKNAGPENIKLVRELMQPRRFIRDMEAKAAGRKPAERAINEKTFWQNVQGRYLADMMKTAEGDVKQKTIINKIGEAIESGRFQAMFPGPRGRLAAENFKRLAEAKNVVLKPNPTGRAGLMVTVGQPLQLLTILGGGVTALAGEPEIGAGIAAGGVGIFLLPEALSQLVLSKGLSRWMINQSALGPITAKGTQGTLALANALDRENIDFEFFSPNAQGGEIPNTR